ncbi:putative sterol-4-alpha-carboxylate 3-dehydrogenase protein [Phaeoacremonium minimum UCRPA7]|uniref:Putative sterol-4-alpha-carboxylate 3-dehydrogenase protein n=1 Tax=Phaeoacremonium minimum (strain UCR-PA7) TaxID=1286976 RepID=R8BHB1_PHAM7|nr:putative sterol-4-alpha-carboxylate 3-dehydrogenase protein [Phaeoacremonium minimum UCRPA7]EON98735.1 putative sterol-4-alpha-carboxylate 3-dehydrogenase protein [Phaeoacremonium minimum UCRPA7]
MDKESYLVTGGCGLQGSHIVEKLRQQYPNARVAVMSRQPEEQFAGVEYLSGDITKPDDIQRVLDVCKPTVVFHCAGVMTVTRKPVKDEVVHAINFDGAKYMLEASQKAGVKAFVFTSSASVVQRARGGICAVANADETWSTVIPEDKVIAYPTAKAAAERLILAADTPGGMRTTALRPALIYGERDNDIIPMHIANLRGGRTWLQIGDNTNLFSATYAGNAADAHLLAAKRLLTDPDGVAAEPFFITNGQDQPFWTFTRASWRAAGDTTPASQVRVISPVFASAIGWVLEWVAWARGTRPAMTRQTIGFVSRDRYFNITKARTVLGYEPKVDWEDGIKRGVKVSRDYPKPIKILWLT